MRTKKQINALQSTTSEKSAGNTESNKPRLIVLKYCLNLLLLNPRFGNLRYHGIPEKLFGVE